jgi:serine/threonine protein kinase/Tfp pilus assembly protein PilF
MPADRKPLAPGETSRSRNLSRVERQGTLRTIPGDEAETIRSRETSEVTREPASELPEHWQQVKMLLEGALERRAGERAAYLDRACGDDPELRREVESLLAAEDEAGSFIEKPVFSLRDHRTEPSLTGRRLGAYRLLEEIGRADDAFDRQVAVKVLKRGLDTDEILDRFHRERRILAHLDHPNIARLLDAGSTDEGLPYLVMEHVEGRPVDVYCDEERLSLDRRLDLFETVCAAVSAAHRNLVVHRDLKPANVLVTDDGTPKLLDFGVAKLLDPGPDEVTPATRVGLQFLTPEYASPEQLEGGPVTTAADVYALGLLLYRLLTGEKAFGATQPGLARPRLERDPEPPSALAPAALRRRLRGDLDAIVLRALARDPEERYRTVEQLVEDLRRHREGLPVRAAAPSALRRGLKFVRRHKVGVGIAAAFLALLLTFTGVVLSLLDTALHEKQRAEEAQHVAEAERERAEQGTRFLEDLVDLASPGRTGGEELTVREAVQAVGRDLLREMKNPRDRAELLDTQGRVFVRMGLNKEAQEPLTEALWLRRILLGDHHPLFAASLHSLAQNLLDSGQPDLAVIFFRQAISIEEQSLPVDDPELASGYNNLAVALQKQGQLEEAEALFLKSLRIKERTLDSGDPDLATGYHNLAGVLLARGRTEEAVRYYRRALEIREASLAAPDPHLATTLNSLGSALETLGHDEEAEGYYRRALDQRRQLYGAKGHKDLIVSLNNLARLLQHRGRLTEAASYFEEILERLDEVPWYIQEQLLRNAADFYSVAGDGVRAEDLAKQALALLERVPARLQWRRADVESVLGEALIAQGRFEEAERRLLQSHILLDEQTQGRDRRYVEEARERLVRLYETWGRPQEAAKFRRPQPSGPDSDTSTNTSTDSASGTGTDGGADGGLSSTTLPSASPWSLSPGDLQ